VLSVSARSKLEDGCSKQAGTFECPDDQFSQQDIDGLVRDSNGGLAGALVLGAAGIACITASAAVIAGSSSSDGDAASAAWRMLPLLAPEDGGRVTAGAVVEARF
jgi:hypothetical protein